MIEGCGFFGKVISHGDFVTRRLPADFLHFWDRWLQSAQLTSRDQLGQDWCDIYLSSPIWRFVLAPGLCGPQAWIGIIMPGIDKVGRHFPLTLAVASANGVPTPAWLCVSDPWFEKLEAQALASLRCDFSLELFNRTLSMIDGPVEGMKVKARRQAGNWVYQLTDETQLDAGLCAIGPLSSAHSLWWSEGSQRVLPCVALCTGLPEAHRFAAMLDGQWATYGWQQISPLQLGSEL